MSHASGSDDCFDSTGVEHMYFNFSPLFPIRAMCNEVNGGLLISLEYFLSTCDGLSACGTDETPFTGRHTEQSPSSSRCKWKTVFTSRLKKYSQYRIVRPKHYMTSSWQKTWCNASKNSKSNLQCIGVLKSKTNNKNQIKHVKNKTCLCIVFILNSAYTVSCAETVDTFGFVAKAVKLQS